MNVELSDTVLQQLAEHAKRLGVRPEELARAAVTDLVSKQSQDFEDAAELVLNKNAELYDRLS